MIALIGFLLLSTFALSGCNEEEAHTVDWWTDHDAERQDFIQECKNNNADEITANCQNAMEAEGKQEIIGKKGSLKSPKISLDKSE